MFLYRYGLMLHLDLMSSLHEYITFRVALAMRLQTGFRFKKLLANVTLMFFSIHMTF